LVAFAFGEHVLDVDRRELRRGGAPVALEPQVFDLLVYLIRNCGRVVSKDDLIEAIWGGRIVSESAVTTGLNAARKAIGDTGAAQQVIRTIPRKGVRFIAEVREDGASVPGERAAGTAETMPLALPDKPSIAVLPFANMSSDPEQEFFADGIAEDIITALSRYPSLFVIARNSCFTYKGRAVDVKQVGRELGVRYVLEGSLRKSGNRIRVTAQLVEARTGNHAWAERYDRDLADIFAVQDEITDAVTIAIAPAIAGAERQRAMRQPPGSLDAWGAYQHGLWHLGNASAGDNTRAQVCFRDAIAGDPNFAGGYSGLSVALWQAAILLQQMPLRQALDTALELARQAVALDAGDAEAHACLSVGRTYVADNEGALVEARQALAMSPNLASAHHALATALIYSGNPAAGIAALKAAVRLDPREPKWAWPMDRIALAYYYDRDYAAAVAEARRVIRSNPDFPHIYRWLAAALAQLGHAEEARQALQHLVAIAPASLDVFVRHRFPAHRPEDYVHMLEGLRKAGWDG
jgi:adenylate cyclase